MTRDEVVSQHARASLEENNTSAYWKYAIGEVVFVVVGILLAFQIDMWGERRNARGTRITCSVRCTMNWR